MNPEKVEAAAALLRNLRGDFRTIDALPDDLRPTTFSEGYAIQDAFARLWDVPVGGWKIGCTAEDQRLLLDVDEPFTGRVFRSVLGKSPASLAASAFHIRGIECAFALRLGADLPTREEPYTPEECAEAVASVHPAIEVVDSRFTDWLAVGGPSLVADNAVNGALVCGEGERNWQKLDLAGHPARLEIDGETVQEGTGRLAYGHPLEALAWLVNSLSARGIGLRAEEFVSTGSCTGIHFVDAGADIRADFDRLGAVRIMFE